jgi:hypothetical protein
MAKRQKRLNGYILYQGPSLYDGAPIVVIATGFTRGSANSKTGRMLQTWIMRADVPPLQALRDGSDTAICGRCKHRSRASGGAGTCYVQVAQAPRGVYNAWKRGIYPIASDLVALGSARVIRIGSYGDPAAVPVAVWQAFTARAADWRGYTHAWQSAPDLASLCMASADSIADTRAANLLGFRAFRVAAFGDAARERGEARCPASEEAGRRVTCATCPLACRGAAALPNIVIQAHGASKRRVAIAA